MFPIFVSAKSTKEFCQFLVIFLFSFEYVYFYINTKYFYTEAMAS